MGHTRPFNFVNFQKWAKAGLFFVYFHSFQTNNINFTTNQCEKMSCPSSIQCRDLNPQPLEHESSPINTRPGLPPEKQSLYPDVFGKS